MFTPNELTEISAAALQDFEKKISEIPSDVCAPYNVTAATLLAELKMAYRFVVIIVRGSEDLAVIAELWLAMASFCEAYAQTLRQLHTEHPLCSVTPYYDLALSIKNTCERIAKFHG